jgi:hypothetical protein
VNSRAGRWIVPFLALLLASFLTACGQTPAPRKLDFSVTGMDARPVTIDMLRAGKPAVIEFWGTT